MPPFLSLYQNFRGLCSGRTVWRPDCMKKTAVRRSLFRSVTKEVDLILHGRSKAFIRDVVVQPLRRCYDVIGVYLILILPILAKCGPYHIAWWQRHVVQSLVQLPVHRYRYAPNKSVTKRPSTTSTPVSTLEAQVVFVSGVCRRGPSPALALLAHVIARRRSGRQLW